MTNAATGTRLSVKSGISFCKNAADAATDLFDQIHQENCSVYLLFVSSKFEIKSLEQALGRTFPPTAIGCTTAGEIGPFGYAQGSLVGVSLASPELHVTSAIIDPLQQIDGQAIARSCERLRAKMDAAQSEDAAVKHFGLLLIDGLSVKEEQIAAQVFHHLREIPMVGGSAGDDMALKKTYIYSEGRFLSDAASISVFTTSLPFSTFKTQHFTPSDKKMVVTAADPEHRIVHEINGNPAALEYARVLDMAATELTPMTFSENPLMLRIRGDYYVRSIQKANTDNGLTFFCAIDEGLVLTLARGVDIVADLRNALRSEALKVGNPLITIGCECVLRRVEVLDKKLSGEMDSLIKESHLVGFHTYGEQFNPIHINQTFAGVMIGE